MDLTQLRYFTSVAECGSFTVAAKKCKVSQPALSQQIAKLEKEFGANLFDRQGRQVTLTRLGHTLKERASEILKAVEDTRRQMFDDGRYGRIVFATATGMGPYLVAKLLQHVGQEFRDSELVFFEQPVANLVQRCEKGEIDLGLVTYPTCCSRDLITQPLFYEEIVLGVSRNHRLSKLSAISLGDLEGEKVIFLNDEHQMTGLIRDTLADSNVTTKVASQVENYTLLNYLVSLEKGIGFFPTTTVPKQVSKNMVYLPVEGQPLRRTLALCWNGRRYQTQLMANFIKAIQEFNLEELSPCDSVEVAVDPMITGEGATQALPLK